LRYLTKILMITVCLIALSGIAAACDVVECKSPGYWKNHPDDWPGETITIGCKDYNKEEAIEIMRTPVKGDKTYNMFNALVAAKLNINSGCCPPSCEIDIIMEADRWMENNSLGSDVRASSDAWQKVFLYCGECTCCTTYPSGEAIYKKLDAFNNGY
jgi:hypothetical protein